MSLNQSSPESPVVQQIVISCLEFVRDARKPVPLPGGVKRDVPERQSSIDSPIHGALRTQEMLLKQIPERENNNLQGVTSLSKLQAGYIKDQEVLNSFRESQNHKRDDGIGLPDACNSCKTSSLGLQLDCSLVAQLQGSLNLDRTQGTTFTITFNELTSKEGL